MEVGHGFDEEIFLRKVGGGSNSDDGSAFIDKGDGAMFEFA